MSGVHTAHVSSSFRLAESAREPFVPQWLYHLRPTRLMTFPLRKGDRIWCLTRDLRCSNFALLPKRKKSRKKNYSKLRSDSLLLLFISYISHVLCLFDWILFENNGSGVERKCHVFAVAIEAFNPPPPPSKKEKNIMMLRCLVSQNENILCKWNIFYCAKPLIL